jgi:hypothetical protein
MPRRTRDPARASALDRVLAAFVVWRPIQHISCSERTVSVNPFRSIRVSHKFTFTGIAGVDTKHSGCSALMSS